jgi:rRNA-processing protein FCF1
MKVLLDSNMLMVPNQFGVDIFEFLKYDHPVTLTSCIAELKKLSRRKTKDGKAARVALQLVKQKKIEVIKTKKRGDAALMDYALRERCAVATNDKELIAKLKKEEIKIIRLRQEKYLAEE